jgi:hypothetical protein
MPSDAQLSFTGCRTGEGISTERLLFCTGRMPDERWLCSLEPEIDERIPAIEGAHAMAGRPGWGSQRRWK